MADPAVSLVMIVRDEEASLARCLESVRGVADEIVVADTGSRDRTPAIAAAFGARVVEYAWQDDFAAARNFARAHATGCWILRLDADEALAPEGRAAVPGLAVPWQEGDLLVAYFGHYVHFADARHDPLHAQLDYGQIALFPNHPAFRFSQPNYDLLAYDGPPGGATARQAPELLVHDYGTADAERRSRRRGQNVAINRRHLALDPGNDYLRFHLCRELHLAGDHEGALLEAYRYLNRRLDGADLHVHHAAQAAYYGAFAALHLGRLAESVELCRLGLELLPHHYGLWTTLAGVYLAEDAGHGEAAGTLRAVVPYLDAPPPPPDAPGPTAWGSGFLRGTAHLLRGEPARALPYFLATWRRFPGSAMHLTCALEAAVRAGDPDLVRELLAAAPPRFPHLQARLRRLAAWADASDPAAWDSLLAALAQWREEWPPT